MYVSDWQSTTKHGHSKLKRLIKKSQCKRRTLVLSSYGMSARCELSTCTKHCPGVRRKETDISMCCTRTRGPSPTCALIPSNSLLGSMTSLLKCTILFHRGCRRMAVQWITKKTIKLLMLPLTTNYYKIHGCVLRTMGQARPRITQTVTS